MASMKAINPAAQPTFMQADISLLQNVDRVCADIAAREQALNLLFMTPGYLTLKGRDETAEGLDRKFALHCYARLRFVTNLLPLLTAAAADADADAGAGGGLSRVVSVLDPLASVRGGGAGALDYADLSLQKTFSVARCSAHASLINSFFLEGLAARCPQTAFVHAYPAAVATGLMRDMPGSRYWAGLATALLKPIMVPLEESGERHLFAATSGRYPPKGVGEGRDGDGVVVGSDGVRGSGCYWVNWDGEVFPANKKIDATREHGAVAKVAQHADEVFRQICEEGKTYS